MKVTISFETKTDVSPLQMECICELLRQALDGQLVVQKGDGNEALHYFRVRREQ